MTVTERLRSGWHRWRDDLRFARVSLVVAGLTLALGILQAFLGRLSSPISLPHLFGAWLPEILEGQWWRLFTWSVFSELGIPHAVVNTLGILALGVPLERVIGSIRWLVTFFVGTLAAFAAEIVGAGWVSLLAGGSGGLLALAGLAVTWRPRLPSTARFIAVATIVLAFVPKPALGWLIPILRDFSDWAHAGGLLAGLVLGFLGSRVPFAAVAAAACIACVVVVLPLVEDATPRSVSATPCLEGAATPAESEGRTVMTIENLTGQPVRMYWAEPGGRSLEGGGEWQLPASRFLWRNRTTFETPSGIGWVITDLADRCLATARVGPRAMQLEVRPSSSKGSECSVRPNKQLECVAEAREGE